MFLSRLTCLALGLCSLVPLAGCQWVPKGQLTACEAQYRASSEQSKAQLAEIANLKAHNRAVENQLMKAEQELAAVDERTRSDRSRLSNYESERELIGDELDGLVHSGRHAVRDRRLIDLCKRHPELKYDAQTGTCKLDTDMLFESGEATLNPESRRKLDHFAKLLKSPESRDFRVMVVGHTDNRTVAKPDTRERYPDNWHLSAARALSVADYLQRAGLRENQVGVTGYGRHQPIAANGTSPDRQRNRRVEVFVMSPETPIVGWIESSPTLYR
jgi:chemotaxis protein MotB